MFTLKRVSTKINIYNNNNHNIKRNIIYFQNKYKQSNDAKNLNINKLFINNNNNNNENININETINEIKQEILFTRSDFGFYQKLLPIDSVQDMISSMNFVFGL